MSFVNLCCLRNLSLSQSYQKYCHEVVPGGKKIFVLLRDKLMYSEVPFFFFTTFSVVPGGKKISVLLRDKLMYSEVPFFFITFSVSMEIKGLLTCIVKNVLSVYPHPLLTGL